MRIFQDILAASERPRVYRVYVYLIKRNENPAADGVYYKSNPFDTADLAEAEKVRLEKAINWRMEDQDDSPVRIGNALVHVPSFASASFAIEKERK